MTSLTMKVRSKLKTFSDDNAEETLDLNIDKVVSLVVPKMIGAIRYGDAKR